MSPCAVRTQPYLRLAEPSAPLKSLFSLENLFSGHPGIFIVINITVIIKKMANMAIRATYYIFCCRNRNWDSPDLMQFWFLCFFWLLFCFCFCFFLFNNPISSSICKLPICSEIYNYTFKKTNKVPIIIIIIIIIIITVIVTYYYHFISNQGRLNIFFLSCLQYLLFLPKRQLQLQHSHQVEEEQGIALFAKDPWEGTTF